MADNYDVQAIMHDLKEKEDMQAEQHDGCYEVMRKTVEAYAKLSDFSALDYKDLNLVYLTTVGTWSQGIDAKKKMVNESNLASEDKKHLTMLWDRVWQKAGRGEYTNYEVSAKGGRSVGLFGTGFFSFKRNNSAPTPEQVERFIRMLIDLLPMTDDDAMFDRAENVLNAPIPGMQAAAASMILHCLKPYTFPILNSNTGYSNIFEVIGVRLTKTGSLETYIDNCRKIKAFRDQNFSCKNYRIFDVEAQNLSKFTIDQQEEWWPSLAEYDPGITAEEYHDLFLNESVVKRTWLEALYEMYKMPDHLGTCKQMGEQYGHTPSHYISYLSTAAGNIAKETKCALLPLEEKNSRYWPVLFQGKYTTEKSQGIYCWKMREPVITAMERLIEEGTFDAREVRKMAQFDHNMILYGPPGTGKTYNSIIYAVAICEGKPIDDLKNEPYREVLLRYNGLRKEGRIAFTTFHQSYGYEEFIEGIKPRLNVDSETLGYIIEDGVFKSFCNRAKEVRVQSASRVKMKSQPRIWGMILGGSEMAELKRQCFANGEIRLGWSEVEDEDIDGNFVADDKASWNGKHMVFDFKNSMEVGDVVVIEKNNKSIDAIGIITGDYVYDKSLGKYPRSRAVEWLVKNIDQDMVPYLPKGRKQLSRFSVFAFDYIGMDVISQILNEHLHDPVVDVEQETKPYVFIIDEINRGNISKIFGELITLIEDKKRAGAAEAMEVILPYSGEPFSVPQNVYIIGTMNTADRSIALMDTALRRRFEFVEMMPDTSVLDRLGIGKITIGNEELNVALMLDVINKRIEHLYDREHTIGHAFFTKLANDPSIETLAGIFEKKVIPLLQEYFYEDYEKIQLVLGDNTKDDEFKFILDRPVKVKSIFNGNPDIDLPEKSYEIQHSAFRKLESYKQIGKDL